MEEVRLCDQCEELPGTIDPQPYGRPTKGRICEACVDREKCELCGKIRPREEMIRYSTGWYCIGENMRRAPDAHGSRNKYRCYLLGERREESGAADLVAEQESIYRQIV